MTTEQELEACYKLLEEIQPKRQDWEKWVTRNAEKHTVYIFVLSVVYVILSVAFISLAWYVAWMNRY